MKTKSQRERTDEFHLLDDEVVEAVPNLRDPAGPGRLIHDAIAIREKLRDARKKVVGELATCTGPGDLGPKTKFDASADAAAILNGVDVSTLESPVQETRRGSLLRQLRALDHAIPLTEDRPRQLECEIISAVCEELRPIAQDFVQATIDACENLLVALQAEAQFHELLRIRGIREVLRPEYLKQWPQMIGWLRGDVHRPPLKKFVELRREAAGLPVDGE